PHTSHPSPLSLPDALPISARLFVPEEPAGQDGHPLRRLRRQDGRVRRGCLVPFFFPPLELVAALWADHAAGVNDLRAVRADLHRSEEHTSELQSRENLVCR